MKLLTMNDKSQANRYHNENVQNQASIICKQTCTRLVGIAEKAGKVSFWGRKVKKPIC